MDAATARLAPRYPIDVYMCEECGHVQHLDVIDPDNLWDSYTYASGEAKGIPEHMRYISAKIRDAVKAPPNALAFDIGSNDGSLLKTFKDAGFRVVGVDPAKEIARRANEAGIPTYPNFMSLELAKKIRDEHGPAHVVTAFNVFAHADNLGEMADCVREMLAPDGLFYFEAQYLVDILDGMLIATIFHEHMSHHSVKPLTKFLDKHGLELISIERADIQLGSIIGGVQLKGGKRPVEASVKEILALEESRGLDKIAVMQDFDARVKSIRNKATALIEKARREGKTIAAFGAARSGPTLIAQLGLTGAIDYIVDNHPQKVGKFSSGDGIEILPTDTLFARKPDYCVILAWVHAQKIIESNQAYLDQGGHFVVLCPDIKVIGKNGEVAI
jgi:SAM-dependent methyltransferase